MKKWVLAAIAFAVVTAPVVARADAKEGTGVSFGPRAAYFIPEDDDADEVWYGGAQFRAYFSDDFALEGSIDYRETEFGPVDVQSYPVQASLLLNLIASEDFKFFILGGAGWYYTRIDVPVGDDETDNRFGPHAGAGLLVPLSESLSIDVTGRYIWLEEAESDNPNVLEREYDDSGIMATAGLNFHF